MNIVVWDKSEERMKSTRADIEKHLKEGFCLIQQKVDVADKSQVFSDKNCYK